VNQRRQKIPVMLKLKRLKGSAPIRTINAFISRIKPSRTFEGIPKRILLFRNDRIGDAMVTLPVLRDIKLNYPDTEIDVITSPNNNFIFEEFPYITNIIRLKINGNETGFFYKLPLIGGLMLFLKYILLPFLFSEKYKRTLKFMSGRGYDYAIDAVGLKRNAIIAGYAAGFTAGPGRLLPFLFYDYYSGSNWVTTADTDFMTRKIEKFITDSTGIRLINKSRDMILPGLTLKEETGKKDIDIIFHIGTTNLRKLGYEKEKEIIKQFSNHKTIITDSGGSDTFLKLKNEFKNSSNITFKLYDTLKDLAEDSLRSELLVCYDGGQAHYLSQYVRTVTIFGPGSPWLWKPYEFNDYKLLSKDTNGGIAIISEGKFRHIAIYRPMWCNPCFDTGCKTRPCLNELTAEFIIDVIKENCLR
jgi:ADP-heptose:LPS heptosyltransferase